MDAASEDVAAVALAAYQRRRDTYPQLVQAGQITADEARADLEGWRAIAKDWRWIHTGEGERTTRLTLDSRTAALDTAISRWLIRHDETGGASEEETEHLAMLCCMRAWAARERTHPSTKHRQFFATITHELRRTHAPNQQEAA